VAQLLGRANLGDLDVTLFVRAGTTDDVLLSSVRDIVVFDKNPRGARKWNLAGRAARHTPPGIADALRDAKIDLAWFMAPNSAIGQVVNTPYIMSVWDVGHADINGLPEVPRGHDWHARDFGLRDQVRRSVHVLTDSVRTGQNLQEMYGIRRKQWTPLGLPLMLKSQARATTTTTTTPSSRFGDLGDFFYYPAIFWAHKNHRVLIEALEKVESRVRLVFTGGDGGNLAQVSELVARRGLDDRVSFLGRVSDSDVETLMRASQGVLMPSALGPTNYPPLEALAVGRPSIISDVHEFDELPESGVTTVETFDPEAWALAMNNVFLHPPCLTPWEALPAEQPLADVIENLRCRLSLAWRTE
jgi:glycosyltransferase involved in cell wall biosynthesis